ncbi:hypothetical protein CCHR01_10710 [Colletotrichum chrysophilum]|uniref:Uncharacterized protein n=1 Tax=Colletotrichum chrysophilum TaxID=1836956 RepID=A0AAD9AEL2_9PEZI|nr:hypothetical protein CCHR01_10710 [Colletotrichum chrysophilum]
MAATVVPVGSLQAKMRDVTRTEPANKPVKIPLSADHHERARSSGLWYLGEVSVWWFLKGLLLGEECASRPNGGAVETIARHNQQQRERAAGWSTPLSSDLEQPYDPRNALKAVSVDGRLGGSLLILAG